jgi:hypothetical protein
MKRTNSSGNAIGSGSIASGSNNFGAPLARAKNSARNP